MSYKKVMGRSGSYVWRFDVHTAAWGRARDTVADEGQTEADLRIHEARLLEALKRRAAGPQKGSLKFGEYAKLYKAHTGKHAGTSLVEDLIRDLDAVSMESVGTAFEGWIAKQGKRLSKYNRPLAPATLQGYRRYFKAICGYACSWDCPAGIRMAPAANPANGLTVGAPYKRTRAITAAERERYLKVLEEAAPWALPAVQFSLQMPIRPEDLCALRWAQIDLLHGQIVYNPAKTSKPDRPNPEATPLIPPDMKAYFAGRIGDGECDRVFYRTDQDGKRVPVHQDALDSAHGRAREKAGLVDLRFYDFRHDAVSRLLSLGFNDHQIMQMAGWKTNMVNHYNCRDRVRLSEIGARLMYQGNSDAKAVNQ